MVGGSLGLCLYHFLCRSSPLGCSLPPVLVRLSRLASSRSKPGRYGGTGGGCQGPAMSSHTEPEEVLSWRCSYSWFSYRIQSYRISGLERPDPSRRFGTYTSHRVSVLTVPEVRYDWIPGHGVSIRTIASNLGQPDRQMP